MRKIRDLLVNHIKSDFNLALYCSLSFFLAIALTLNYLINLENGIIDSYVGKPIRIVWYFLLYSFAYYSGLLITLIFQQKVHLLEIKKMWLLSLTGLMILAWSTGFPYHNQLMNYLFSGSRFYSVVSTCLHYFQNALNPDYALEN